MVANSILLASFTFTYDWKFVFVLKVRHVKAAIKPSADHIQEAVTQNDYGNSSRELVGHLVDAHYEDSPFRHASSISTDMSDDHDSDYSAKTVIGIGSGITSAGLKNVTADNIIWKFQFFTALLPSFCRTASKSGYQYNFYVAYDSNDAVFSQPNHLVAFQNAFTNSAKNATCPSNSMSLRLVECNHTGHPAWAQNDAMMEAYLDGSQYFYRLNDDSIMLSSGWTELFIDKLATYVPPNVGVVGPNHTGGNERILTHDFVHRTHVEVFGFYYPRVFTDWYADDWISNVYQPHHATKLQNVLMHHTKSLGRRYKNTLSVRSKLAARVKTDMITLIRQVSGLL
jgi:hypothetical protein